MKHKETVLFRLDEIEMQLPVQIGDYTDFYSSIEHATNVGTCLEILIMRYYQTGCIFRWVTMAEVRLLFLLEFRYTALKGKHLPNGATEPVFGPSKLIDFELEMAFITTDANDLGEPIPVEEAEEYIFGLGTF